MNSYFLGLETKIIFRSGGFFKIISKNGFKKG